MNLIEGSDYKRDGETRTLLFDLTFTGIIPGFDDMNIALKSQGIYLLHGRLLLTQGYTWDGASGRTRDRWFNGRHNAVRGPMARDALYMATRAYLGPLHDDNEKQYRYYQKAADDYFYNVLKADGMPWWRRSLWYRTVRWLGFPHITGQKLDSERALAA